MAPQWNPAAGDLFPGSLVASVGGALWAWLLALLLGAALLPLAESRESRAADRLLSWAVLGVAAQTLVWLLLSFAGALRPRVVIGAAAALTLAGAAVGGRRVVRAAVLLARSEAAEESNGGEARAPWLFGVALGACAVLLLAVAWLALWPTVFYDDLVYHVAAPRQALLTGAWPAMPGMHYSFMPAGWDAAYLLPLALGGGSGPQLMNLVGLGLLVWAVYRLSRNGGGAGAALAATALLVAAPMTISLGAFAGNDLFVALALCVALERLVATSGNRPVQLGLLTGAAWGAKYTALAPSVGIGVAAAVLSSGSAVRRLRRAAVVGLVTLLVPALWTARSLVLTGNPVYPALWRIFGGAYWDAQSARLVAEQASHGGLVDRGPAAFVLALVDLVRNSGELGFPSGVNPLFVLLGLAGLLVLSRRVRGSAGLATTILVGYLGWCVTSLNVRYALAMLAALGPFAAAVIQRGVEFAGGERARRVLAPLLPALLALAAAGPTVHGVRRHMDYYGSRTRLVGGTPRREMQVTRLDVAAAGRALAAQLPPGARILLVAEGRSATLPRPTLASSAYDRPDIARFIRGAGSLAELNARLGEFTHVVVNFRELERFREQYGFAERFEPEEWELFRRWLAEGLDPVERFGNVVVYRIPRPQTP